MITINRIFTSRVATLSSSTKFYQEARQHQVYIRGLPRNFTKDDIASEFKNKGLTGVNNFDLKVDPREPTKFSGRLIATFETEKDAIAASKETFTSDKSNVRGKRTANGICLGKHVVVGLPNKLHGTLDITKSVQDKISGNYKIQSTSKRGNRLVLSFETYEEAEEFLKQDFSVIHEEIFANMFTVNR